MSEEKPASGTKCCEKTWPKWTYRGEPCENAAKVVRYGKPYCGRHDPVAVIARKDKRNAKWKESWDAEKAARAAAERVERERRADCYDDLLNTLVHIHEYWNRDQNETSMSDALWHIIDEASAAIAKAKGE